MLQRVSKYASSAVSLEEASKSVLSRVAAAAAAGMGREDDDIDDGYEDYETMANWSYQRSPVCDGCFCPVPSCPDHPFIRRVVRWVKIIARSKHGMTVVFGVLPLILGLLLGFYLGRHWEQRQNNKQKSKVDQGDEKVPVTWTCLAWKKCVSTFFLLRAFSVSVATYFFTAQWAAKESREEKSTVISNTELKEYDKEDLKRLAFLKDPSQYRQSGVDLNLIPKHIAFIMDGNRRYGKAKYKSASRGHMDGGYKLRDMVNWCMEERIQEMTVYAFSTENWNRSPAEIDALMSIFCQQCEQLRIESKKLQIVVRVLSTDTAPVSI